ncbi:hypothetical protein OG558_23780 [Kribbella sp. NBC_01510]|uniref:hypothetical protein n=1 Tax=Kribbella sp. NBC_01510 TaxID=2903581 RepID=UPI00386F9B68
MCSTGFDWGQDDYQTPSWDDLVIYELHVGTYNDTVGGPPGSFASVEAKLVVESVQILPATTVVGQFRDQVAARRGHNIGVVAAARRQLEYVFCALRDHHVRALNKQPDKHASAA